MGIERILGNFANFELGQNQTAQELKQQSFDNDLELAKWALQQKQLEDQLKNSEVLRANTGVEMEATKARTSRENLEQQQKNYLLERGRVEQEDAAYKEAVRKRWRRQDTLLEQDLIRRKQEVDKKYGYDTLPGVETPDLKGDPMEAQAMAMATQLGSSLRNGNVLTRYADELTSQTGQVVTPEQVAKQMADSFGWTEDQFNAFYYSGVSAEDEAKYNTQLYDTSMTAFTKMLADPNFQQGTYNQQIATVAGLFTYMEKDPYKRLEMAKNLLPNKIDYIPDANTATNANLQITLKNAELKFNDWKTRFEADAAAKRNAATIAASMNRLKTEYSLKTQLEIEKAKLGMEGKTYDRLKEMNGQMHSTLQQFLDPRTRQQLNDPKNAMLRESKINTIAFDFGEIAKGTYGLDIQDNWTKKYIMDNAVNITDVKDAEKRWDDITANYIASATKGTKPGSKQEKDMLNQAYQDLAVVYELTPFKTLLGEQMRFNANALPDPSVASQMQLAKRVKAPNDLGITVSLEPDYVKAVGRVDKNAKPDQTKPGGLGKRVTPITSVGSPDTPPVPVKPDLSKLTKIVPPSSVGKGLPPLPGQKQMSGKVPPVSQAKVKKQKRG